MKQIKMHLQLDREDVEEFVKDFAMEEYNAREPITLEEEPGGGYSIRWSQESKKPAPKPKPKKEDKDGTLEKPPGQAGTT